MKKSKVKVCLIIVLVIILVIGFGGILIAKKLSPKEEFDVQNKEEKKEEIIEEEKEEFTEKIDDEMKINTSEKVNEVKDIEGFKFENTKLFFKNGLTELSADVTNNKGKDTGETLVDLILVDKDGNEIITVGGILSPMKAGEVSKYKTTITLDYANAYDFLIKVK